MHFSTCLLVDRPSFLHKQLLFTCLAIPNNLCLCCTCGGLDAQTLTAAGDCSYTSSDSINSYSLYSALTLRNILIWLVVFMLNSNCFSLRFFFWCFHFSVFLSFLFASILQIFSILKHLWSITNCMSLAHIHYQLLVQGRI